MELYREIGQRLRARREQLQMSQSEVAAAAQLHRSSVANIEAGRQRIALDDLVLLARALKVDYRTWLPDPASLDLGVLAPPGNAVGEQTSAFLSRHGVIQEPSAADDDSA